MHLQAAEVNDALSADLVEEAVRQFEAHLKSQGLKQTRQRRLILDAFLSTNDHLTAEDLYELVRARDRSVGFATVYRTLHLIVESGIARQREFAAGRKFYEHVVGETQHHHHLICTDCGKIIEFICPEVVERAQEQIAEDHGFKLVRHTHELFGVCPACQSRS